MFERFSDQARRAVVLAQEESLLLNHNYIGTEHILLGLVHEGEGVAAKALESLGISLEAVRAQVEEIIGHGGDAPSGHVPFTPRAKRVLELSLREALQLGHNYIGTEHILLGLIREGDGVAALVLAGLGADLERARATVIGLLAAEGTERTLVWVDEGPGDAAQTQSFMRERGLCLLCGRDLWEVDRYVRGERGAVCDECIVGGARALDQTPDAERAPRLAPRVFGAENAEAGASDAITEAFESAFAPGTSPADQAPFIEDADEVQPFMAEAAERAPGYTVTGINVSRIRFVGLDRADVRLTVEVSTLPSDFVFDGSAVRRAERWLVSRDTISQMIAGAGVRLPPPE